MKLIRGAGAGPAPKPVKVREPQTSPDSLDSRSYALILDLLSEGEIQGLKDGAKSIFLNNTPLRNANGSSNFEGFDWDFRNGTQNQDYIPGFDEILNEIPVNTQVTKSTSVTKTITRQSVDAVRITISVPQLQRIDSTGDTRGSFFVLKITTQGNGGQEATRIVDTIRGRTSDLYQKDYRVSLAGLNYPVNIKVSRESDDSTDARDVNAFSWFSYTEITYAKLTYPNSALASLRIDAEQFNNIPERSYLIRGIKVRIPSNATVDPTTGALIYSGVWNGNFAAATWTSDPAWCLWDLLTSTRYGFGDYLNTNLLDKWSFYAASVYCGALNTRPGGTTNDYHPTTGRHGVPDGLGNYEPRFSCNALIQTADDAYKLINDMCSVFRAMPYWSAGSLVLSQDAPASPSYVFTLSNVAEPGFTYSGSSQKTRATVVVVKYFDNDARDFAYEVVEDRVNIAKYGVTTKEVEAFACTSRGQAHRFGEWLLYAEQYETEVVTFTASLDAGVLVRPGQVISIHDPVRFPGYRWAGRIVAATTTAITLDSADTITAGTSPKLTVLMPDGTLQQRNVSSISGNVVTVSSAFSTTPNANSVWFFENSSLAPATTWRVLTVQEKNQTEYEISALAYNASKYNYIERGEKLDIKTYSFLYAIPEAPSSLAATESLYSYQNEVRSKVTLAWGAVKGATAYEVQWRRDSGNWTTDRVQAPLHEILNITPGTFEYRVYSLNVAEFPSSTYTTLTFTAVGKTAPPANVTGFTAAIDPVIGVTLSWDPVLDLDLQGYEIWQGTSFGNGDKLGIIQGTSYKVGAIPPQAVTNWWIKALDTSGTYSQSATGISVTFFGANAPAVTAAINGTDFELRWNAVSGTLATSAYEIRFGTTSSTWATATPITTVNATTFRQLVNWSGARRFFVAALDINGLVGTAGTADITILAPSLPSVSQQVVDNNVLLRWNDCTRSLPIVYYEVRRGATWATATSVGTKQGLFTTVFETASGTYTYWIAGIDSAGNIGAPGSVAAVVGQPPDYQLQMDANSAFGGTKTNSYVENGILIAPVITDETWTTHFTTARAGFASGWQTIQNQYNAGFLEYATPSASTGSYEEAMDYGAILPGSKITASLTYQTIAGAVTVTPMISVRKLATDPWTDYPNTSSVFATDFRYLKVRYDFASTGGDDLIAATALNIRLDAKLRNDFGSGSAKAPAASTYSQTLTTITVTTPTAHGLAAGTKVDLNFTSGTAADGIYTIATVPTATTFTVTSATSATTSGNVTVHDGGTVVTFSVAFVDVQSITVTPATTTAVIAVYDFNDVPNPTSFKVLLFDTAGNRVSGNFSWSARGV